MKILHVFDFFSPQGGGSVDVIFKLTRAQVQRGHEVVLFTSDYKLDRAYIDSLPGVKGRVLHCVSGAGAFYIIPGMVTSVRNQLRNFDIVHLDCFRSFQNVVVRHYARKFGLPYIVEIGRAHV